MKRTLLIALLAALMGGPSFAAEGIVYRISEMTPDEVLSVDAPVATVVVDEIKTLESVHCTRFSSLTVDFQECTPLAGWFNYELVGEGSLIITSSPEIAAYWEKILIAKDSDPLPLFYSVENMIFGMRSDQITFLGHGVNEKVMLGGTEVTFIGVIENERALGEKQVGLLYQKSSSSPKQVLLVGRLREDVPMLPTGPDALDVALVNSLWASSAYVREFVRLSGAQGYALKDGGTAVWGSGFGTFMHVTGDKGFKSNGGGYGIGVNHAFSADTRGGISFGQGFGSYHNSGADGAKVHQRAILAAATASTRITKDLSLGGHLAFGSVRNRADCRLDGESGRARWNDNVFNLGVQAAYDFHVTEATAITPFLGLDWMNGAHESFGGAYARHYSHGRLNELRMPVGVTVSTSAEVGSTKLLPQLSVAYVPSLAQQLPHAEVSDENGNYRVKGYAPGRNAFMLNAGVNAVFSDSWSAGAFYTLETRRHCVDQSVNASVRYTF